MNNEGCWVSFEHWVLSHEQYNRDSLWLSLKSDFQKYMLGGLVYCYCEACEREQVNHFNK